MLSTEKITHAFTAICEEAEKLLEGQTPGHVKDGLTRIVSIAKGSRKNKFSFLGVEAPDWQGTKAKEYRDIPCFCNAASRDGSTDKNVKLFLREP